MRYFEDFAVGQTLQLGARTVSAEEIVAFARKWDPQPFHVDEEAGRRSPFGGLVASGWHTVAMTMRMIVDGLLHDVASLGSPGVDQVRWLKPVRPGDRLELTSTVRSATPSRSKPDRGVIMLRHELRNQNGEPVMLLDGMSLMGRRP